MSAFLISGRLNKNRDTYRCLEKTERPQKSLYIIIHKQNNRYLYFSGRQPTFNLIFACAFSIKLDVRYAKCSYEHIVAERKKDSINNLPGEVFDVRY